ncbi:MAG: 2-C-methyl-D-erythritol 2,4-cyclodiphosphate synthase [Bacteroidales bacterium]|nr:2-C-methyl-D-erythritol 2,4-cyclodiphosphate synthase [Bacteroidales bacterium]MBP3343704.1 2-C-methyl-D-erythritol 2,4-cyclodiphosphate synthase [Bacteroidales bacterium]MBQ6871018.1 2-C-methyl-D-erythritol 2,4-cyclodiphosphate synthase [Bacteroidales bacterium]MBQ8034333.1 2-C-methyl-D-erythritol 2,4-cyclodiphosphate synthase [Bacteroidales bacterium]MBR4095066.1 2-C-methyl-D-erythritol 2,4-cyclodiphosphate synthase [Bacteroidales bacterium]
MNLRIGQGYDVHRLADGLPFYLGGVKIEHTKGCIAHSDGDTLIHALCDALLGALALGDIGKHFPDTSAEFKGIDSKILLDRTYSLIKEQGYELVNADCTILLQKPKIAPYIVPMREKLASVLKINKNIISVKATTTEGVGFVGREEAVAVYATVLVEKK